MFKWIKSKLGFLKDKVYLNILAIIGKKLFGDKWKGAKTLVSGFLVFALGLFEWVSGSGLYNLLCQANESMCDLEQSTFYGVILAIVGGMQQVLRVITDTPVQPE